MVVMLDDGAGPIKVAPPPPPPPKQDRWAAEIVKAVQQKAGDPQGADAVEQALQQAERQLAAKYRNDPDEKDTLAAAGILAATQILAKQVAQKVKDPTQLQQLSMQLMSQNLVGVASNTQVTSADRARIEGLLLNSDYTHKLGSGVAFLGQSLQVVDASKLSAGDKATLEHTILGSDYANSLGPGTAKFLRNFLDALAKAQHDPNDTDAVVTATFDMYMVRTADQPQQESGAALDNELGQDLGMKPDRQASSAADQQALANGKFELYSGKQLDAIRQIAQQIRSVGGSDAKVTALPVIFAPQGKDQLEQHVLWRVTGANGKTSYVSDEGRTYKDVQDFMDHNKLSFGKLYVAHDGHLTIDGNGQVQIDTHQKSKGFWDYAKEIGTDVVEGLAIAGGVVLTAAAVIGSDGALAPVMGYAWAAILGGGALGIAQGGSDLYDRSQHGQSIGLNSQTLGDYVNIAAGLAAPVGAAGQGMKTAATTAARTTATVADNADAASSGGRTLGNRALSAGGRTLTGSAAVVNFGAFAYSTQDLVRNWNNLSVSDKIQGVLNTGMAVVGTTAHGAHTIIDRRTAARTPTETAPDAAITLDRNGLPVAPSTADDDGPVSLAATDGTARTDAAVPPGGSPVDGPAGMPAAAAQAPVATSPRAPAPLLPASSEALPAAPSLSSPLTVEGAAAQLRATQHDDAQRHNAEREHAQVDAGIRAASARHGAARTAGLPPSGRKATGRAGSARPGDGRPGAGRAGTGPGRVALSGRNPPGSDDMMAGLSTAPKTGPASAAADGPTPAHLILGGSSLAQGPTGRSGSGAAPETHEPRPPAITAPVPNEVFAQAGPRGGPNPSAAPGGGMTGLGSLAARLFGGGGRPPDSPRGFNLAASGEPGEPSALTLFFGPKQSGMLSDAVRNGTFRTTDTIFVYERAHGGLDPSSRRSLVGYATIERGTAGGAPHLVWRGADPQHPQNVPMDDFLAGNGRRNMYCVVSDATPDYVLAGRDLGTPVPYSDAAVAYRNRQLAEGSAAPKPEDHVAEQVPVRDINAAAQDRAIRSAAESVTSTGALQAVEAVRADVASAARGKLIQKLLEQMRPQIRRDADTLKQKLAQDLADKWLNAAETNGDFNPAWLAADDAATQAEEMAGQLRDLRAYAISLARKANPQARGDAKELRGLAKSAQHAAGRARSSAAEAADKAVPDIRSQAGKALAAYAERALGDTLFDAAMAHATDTVSDRLDKILLASDAATEGMLGAARNALQLPVEQATRGAVTQALGDPRHVQDMRRAASQAAQEVLQGPLRDFSTAQARAEAAAAQQATDRVQPVAENAATAASADPNQALARAAALQEGETGLTNAWRDIADDAAWQTRFVDAANDVLLSETRQEQAKAAVADNATIITNTVHDVRQSVVAGPLREAQSELEVVRNKLAEARNKLAVPSILRLTRMKFLSPKGHGMNAGGFYSDDKSIWLVKHLKGSIPKTQNRAWTAVLSNEIHKAILGPDHVSDLHVVELQRDQHGQARYGIASRVVADVHYPENARLEDRFLSPDAAQTNGLRELFGVAVLTGNTDLLGNNRDGYNIGFTGTGLKGSGRVVVLDMDSGLGYKPGGRFNRLGSDVKHISRTMEALDGIETEDSGYHPFAGLSDADRQQGLAHTLQLSEAGIRDIFSKFTDIDDGQRQQIETMLIGRRRSIEQYLSSRTATTPASETRPRVTVPRGHYASRLDQIDFPKEYRKGTALPSLFPGFRRTARKFFTDVRTSLPGHHIQPPGIAWDPREIRVDTEGRQIDPARGVPLDPVTSARSSNEPRHPILFNLLVGLPSAALVAVGAGMPTEVTQSASVGRLLLNVLKLQSKVRPVALKSLEDSNLQRAITTIQNYHIGIEIELNRLLRPRMHNTVTVPPGMRDQLVANTRNATGMLDALNRKKLDSFDPDPDTAKAIRFAQAREVVDRYIAAQNYLIGTDTAAMELVNHATGMGASVRILINATYLVSIGHDLPSLVQQAAHHSYEVSQWIQDSGRLASVTGSSAELWIKFAKPFPWAKGKAGKLADWMSRVSDLGTSLAGAESVREDITGQPQHDVVYDSFQGTYAAGYLAKVAIELRQKISAFRQKRAEKKNPQTNQEAWTADPAAAAGVTILNTAAVGENSIQSAGGDWHKLFDLLRHPSSLGKHVASWSRTENQYWDDVLRWIRDLIK